MNCCVKGTSNILSSSKRVVSPAIVHAKIPRPPNAFMLYANEHRKAMAHLFPADSNKEISRRLGQTWKDLNMQEKNQYFQKARDIDIEHKKKYPGYVYNPKDARIRKAIRTSLKDRSIAASPIFSRNNIRRTNVLNAPELYQNLIMSNPLNQIQSHNPMWNGLCDFSTIPKDQSPYYTDNLPGSSSNNAECSSAAEGDQNQNVGETMHVYENPIGIDPLGPDGGFIMSNSEGERSLFERERVNLEAAENYMKLDKLKDSPYLPISATKFVKNPELFTNNAEYHKEYIIKYFNHIPDYETFNVTTEDGVSFPYVTIPNLIVRQNLTSPRYAQ